MSFHAMPNRIDTMKHNQKKKKKKECSKFYAAGKRDRKVNACSWQEQIIENHLSFYFDNLLHARQSSYFFFIHSIFTWSFILCFYRSFYFLHKIVDNFMRWLLNEMAHQFMSIERVQMMTLFPKAEIIPWSSMLIWGEIKHRNEQSDKRKCKQMQPSESD